MGTPLLRSTKLVLCAISRPLTAIMRIVLAMLVCSLGVATAQPQFARQHSFEDGPSQHSEQFVSEEEFDSVEPYQFAMQVNDEEFANYQERSESQDENGRVTGQYSWLRPDGVRMIVTYTADGDTGFNAQVREEQTDIKVPSPVPFYSGSDEQ